MHTPRSVSARTPFRLRPLALGLNDFASHRLLVWEPVLTPRYQPLRPCPRYVGIQ